MVPLHLKKVGELVSDPLHTALLLAAMIEGARVGEQALAEGWSRAQWLRHEAARLRTRAAALEAQAAALETAKE